MQICGEYQISQDTCFYKCVTFYFVCIHLCFIIVLLLYVWYTSVHVHQYHEKICILFLQTTTALITDKEHVFKFQFILCLHFVNLCSFAHDESHPTNSYLIIMLEIIFTDPLSNMLAV